MSRTIVSALVIAGALASFGCQEVVPPSTALVEDEPSITGVAVDAFSLYFIKQDGSVKSVALDGGPAVELATEKIADPTHIALDENFVYVGTMAGTVARVPKTAGAVQTLIEGQPDIRGLAVDQTHVYFAAGDVRRMSLADFAEEAPLAPGPIGAGTLVHDAGYLYWSGGSTSGAVQAVHVAGGDVQSMGVLQSGIGAVGVDGSHIYWGATDLEDPQVPLDTLRRMGHDGSGECEVVSDQGHIFRVVADEKNVYWTSLREGAVSTAPSHCDAIPDRFSYVRDGEDEQVFLAQDVATIYYARSKTGTISARPKQSIVTP
jgi:hypothetical protein